MITPPIVDTWANRLPEYPLCCDVFEHGVFARPRLEALTHQYVQFNPRAFVNWLIFDIDRQDSFEAWEHGYIHPPNLYVQNPANGHGHLFYALATPVGMCNSHRSAPIQLCEAIAAAG